MKLNLEAEDISSQVFGKYQTGFFFGGYCWSDQDENWNNSAVPKWGALSEPGEVRARYIPGFRLWQLIGLIPKGPHKDW